MILWMGAFAQVCKLSHVFLEAHHLRLDAASVIVPASVRRHFLGRTECIRCGFYLPQLPTRLCAVCVCRRMRRWTLNPPQMGADRMLD